MSLLDDCLARIREDEPRVHAWVEVCPQAALGAGLLDGIPFGAKDIFETRDLATEYGSPLFAGRKGSCDATLIEDLRRRGAVLLGKTHTTSFAYFDPAPTRNPCNPEHTPGGSSSGSAAAVACGMALFALGTQTAGSIIRPASYCGVVGFKPTFGVLPLDGVMPFAASLDTAGLFTRDAAWMARVWRGMGFDVVSEISLPLHVPALPPPVEPMMAAAFELSVDRLRRAGFRVESIELPFEWMALVRAVSLVQDYEGAHTLRSLWEQHGERMGAKLAELIRRGLATPEEVYIEALHSLSDAAKRMEGAGIVLTPAAPGAAPKGLASTGSPALNSPWTGLGVPAICVPMPTDGLPLGLQIAGERGADGALLHAAVEIERALTASL